MGGDLVVLSKTGKNLGSLLLINPSAPFLIDERVFYPTTIAYVAAQARAAGFTVDVLDLAGSEDAMGEIADTIQRKTYDAVGLTATSPQFPHTVNALRTIRKVKPEQRVILGGAHATPVSKLRRKNLEKLLQVRGASDTEIRDAVMNDQMEGSVREALYASDPNFAVLSEFDVVVEGEGEASIVETMHPDDPKFLKAGLITDLDSLPFPAWDTIDMESYRYSIDGEPATVLMTQRGCPFQCYFCCGRDVEMYMRARYHGVERVVAEMDALHERYGYRAFMIFDDELNVNIKRTLELTEALKHRDYIFRAFVKSELYVKQEKKYGIGERMREAGFVELCTGAESGSERILTEVVGKHTTPQTNADCTHMVQDAGMRMKVFTIIGHPSESEADALETLDWVKRVRPNGFDISILTLYPGSSAYNNLEEPVNPQRPFFRGSVTAYAFYELLRAERVDFSDPSILTCYKGVPGQYNATVETLDGKGNVLMSSKDLLRMRQHIEDEGRRALGLPPLLPTEEAYDHSMGQGKAVNK